MSATQGTPTNLRVLIIDFNAVVREGLHSILDQDAVIEFMGDVSDGAAALAYIKQAKAGGKPVDVVLTEVCNGKVDGVQAIRLIKDEFPNVAVLVLTANINDSYIIDAIHAGAGGYMFLKDMSTEMLLQSIHRVVEGGTQMKTELLHNAVENLIHNGRKTLSERTAEAAHLTAREVDVLRLLGNGDSNKTISDTLGITLDTAKKHVSNVINKMQARSRTHVAIIAAQAGIIGNPVTTVIPKTQSEPSLAG